MREAEAAGENATALAAIRLLLLTGLRRMEALGLPRAWVDSPARCIRFEDTKSGAQLRPIGAEAVKLIEGQPSAMVALGCSLRQTVTATLSAFRKYWNASAQTRDWRA